MDKTLERMDYVQANEAARAIAEAAIVGYWMECKGLPDDAAYHATKMRDRLDRLCEIMGLSVIEAVTIPQHRHNDAAMLQSARNMIPEE